jgi:uncharacterized BrkB/YihY/UPF0761 family membrane protein
MNISEQTGETVRTFFDALKSQPLSLALVVMNFLLLGFLFYNGMTALDQRRQTVELIVGWQKETDRLMAQCVSADIMKLVLDALEAVRKQTSPPKPLELPLIFRDTPDWAAATPAAIPVPVPRPLDAPR